MTRYRDDRYQNDRAQSDRTRYTPQDREWAQRDWNPQDNRSPDRYGDDRARDMAGDYGRTSQGMTSPMERWDTRQGGRDYSRDDGRQGYGRPDLSQGYGVSGYGPQSDRGYGSMDDRSFGRTDDRYGGEDLRWRNLRWDADQQAWRGQGDFGARQDSRFGQGASGAWSRQDSGAGYRSFGDSDRPQDSQSTWGGRSETFRGRGPKGYQRSDDRIKEMVSDALEDDDRLDASNIEVQVQGGEVTLTGTVSDRAQKRRAEDCVDTLRGVKDVHNQLRVQQGMAGTSSNAAGNGMTGTTNRNDTTPTVSSTAKS
ncbi:BON domain-containing protein [Deinococcus sp. KSM4-11]|uniref:BON domain-containing protein n=1 Tax=Deinococcus sp. KSM4-11 TaxID=2568654 RepID=UPI001F0E59C2|nr:BON domain-containing protein [Deinococcus sp. KSM4-11]